METLENTAYFIRPAYNNNTVYCNLRECRNDGLKNGIYTGCLHGRNSLVQETSYAINAHPEKTWTFSAESV